MLARSIVMELWSLTKPTLAIVLFLVILKMLVFRDRIPHIWLFVSAVLLTVVGLYLFLAGVSSSLVPLSRSTAFHLVATRNKALIIAFACVLGYLATLIEPGLRTLAIQIEDVSVGAISRSHIIHTAAMGFALGAGAGVARILFGFAMKPVAVCALVVMAALVLMASDHVIAIAFDAASATTGPVNIPMLLGLTIGLAQAVDGADPIRYGFGLIALTAYGTTAAVLMLGILGGR